jgi:hypothetical protein
LEAFHLCRKMCCAISSRHLLTKVSQYYTCVRASSELKFTLKVRLPRATKMLNEVRNRKPKMSSLRYKIFGCSGTFAALGLGTIAGIFVGLPLIITKNESGFLPILLFPILSVAIWQAIRNRNAKSTTDVPEEIEEKGTLLADRHYFMASKRRL